MALAYTEALAMKSLLNSSGSQQLCAGKISTSLRLLVARSAVMHVPSRKSYSCET